MNSVSSGFFRTLGIPLIAGRDFNSADTAESPKVAIVNEAFLKKFKLGNDAVGRRIGQQQADMQIVGIVEPQLLEWDAAGMIGVTVQAGQMEAAATAIAKFPEVTYLFMASGGFDLFVEVYCRDRKHFVSFLNDRLQKTPGVERTETFMILKMYKLSYRWGEAEAPPAVW